jgi:glycosyltransferase involved in cell wall biosynthesis
MKSRDEKRIVIDVTPVLYGSKGGIGRTTKKLVETMLRLETGYEIRLFGRRMCGRNSDCFATGAPIARLRLPRSFETIIQQLGIIELICPGELYHATDFYLPVKRPEKVVATINDIIFLVEAEDMIDHTRLAKWVPPFAKTCSHIIAASDYTKKDLIERLQIDPCKITVVHWGVDRDVFYPAEDKENLRERLKRGFGIERPYFFSMSCSAGRKNTPFLLETYGRLLEAGPVNDLVLVWNPLPELREKYSTPSFAGRVHFLGSQSDDNLRDLYSGATALIFPSLYEGFGLPILEAMACGTPVITSNVSSMPEVGGDAALYIDPRDSGSLVRAMELFENNSQAAEELREKGFKRLSRFSWNRCAQETLGVYSSCLQ